MGTILSWTTDYTSSQVESSPVPMTSLPPSDILSVLLGDDSSSGKIGSANWLIRPFAVILYIKARAPNNLIHLLRMQLRSRLLHNICCSHRNSDQPNCYPMLHHPHHANVNSNNPFRRQPTSRPIDELGYRFKGPGDDTRLHNEFHTPNLFHLLSRPFDCLDFKWESCYSRAQLHQYMLA